MTIHKIEMAKSARSRCRECKQKIAKNELRLGVGQAQESGGHSYIWYHLKCATVKRFLELEEALLSTESLNDKYESLHQEIDLAKSKLPTLSYPYSTSGGALEAYHCIHCKDWSFPKAQRIITQVELKLGKKNLIREAPLHVGCANAYLKNSNLLSTVINNSEFLSENDLQWLQKRLT